MLFASGELRREAVCVREDRSRKGTSWTGNSLRLRSLWFGLALMGDEQDPGGRVLCRFEKGAGAGGARCR